jgi:hypothetical protein
MSPLPVPAVLDLSGPSPALARSALYPVATFASLAVDLKPAAFLYALHFTGFDFCDFSAGDDRWSRRLGRR